jgi:methionine-rich copper-binding protein CopC
VALTTAASAPPAFHASLKKAVPGKGDTVAVSPDTLTLWFSEKVEIPLTKVALSGGGAARKLGAPAFGGTSADAPVVVAVEEKLAPGTYKVDWTVAGKDGHPSKGSYEFVLKAGR